MSEQQSVKGSCLCGKITLSVTSFSRQVVACHCQQCRKQTGTYVSAAAVDDSNLTVSGSENIKWYAASDTAQRGFCAECGSLLFWKRNDSDSTSVMAGCLEAPTGLSLVGHIFTESQGDYYTIEDSVPKFAQSDSSLQGNFPD